MEHLSQIFSDRELVSLLEKHSRRKHLDRDETLFLAGDELHFVPILLNGSLRIVREDEEGREVFLYHLYPLQSCAMALNGCQSNRKSLVKAVAEDKTDVLLVPAQMVDELYKFPEWKSFINETYSSRFAELIEVIDLIAFSSLDEKIWNYLKRKSDALQTSRLSITHQQIASELNTHREAVSRILGAMEKKAMIKLGRNLIEIL